MDEGARVDLYLTLLQEQLDLKVTGEPQPVLLQPVTDRGHLAVMDRGPDIQPIKDRGPGIQPIKDRSQGARHSAYKGQVIGGQAFSL